MHSFYIIIENLYLYLRTNNKFIFNKLYNDFCNSYSIVNEIPVKPGISINICLQDSYNTKISKLCHLNYLDNKFICATHRGIDIILNKYNKSIDIITTNASEVTLDIIEKIIISCISVYLENYNCFYLHASGVCKNNNSIIFLGNKFSGKTSFMCHLLDIGFDFISNDRIGIISSEIINTCIGFPTSIGLRLGTIYNCISPHTISNFLNNNSFKSSIKDLKLNLTGINSLYNNSIINNNLDFKFNVFIEDFLQIFNTTIITKSNLKIIIFLEYSQITELPKIIKIPNHFINNLIKNYTIDSFHPAMPYIRRIQKSKKVLPQITDITKIICFKIQHNFKNLDTLNSFFNNIINFN